VVIYKVPIQLKTLWLSGICCIKENRASRLWNFQSAGQ
jgi:hypothetical protein